MDPDSLGVVGEEIATLPGNPTLREINKQSPASYWSRCNRKRPAPPRGSPGGDPGLPSPTPPPGPPPAWVPPGIPPPSCLLSSAPSLRPRAFARPRAVSRWSTGRPGPLGTFDDAFGGGEVEVPPGHGPLGLLPVQETARRAPPPSPPAVSAPRGRSVSRAPARLLRAA